MKKTASFPIIFLLILLCLAAPISSADAEIQGVATVIALRGTVVAQSKGGAARNLSLKSQIFQEDVLKTDKNGQLQIMFTDSSIISLGRDSEMKIAEYRWQPEQKDGALKTQAKEGTFRVMGGALAKDAPQNFKTETPTATIGIRGSMYTFKTTKDSLSVVFQGGKGIEVFNEMGKVTITAPGFGTRVVLNAAPAKPSKFTEQDIKNMNKGLNGGGESSNGTGGKDGGATDNGTAPLSETISQPPPPIDYVDKPDPDDINKEIDFSLPPPPPSDGIFAFEGTLGGVYTRLNESTETFINSMTMGVNWHNHRIFGIAYENDKENPAFFFGSVNGSIVSDLTIFGVDDGYENSDIAFINGGGDGIFAGAAYDFFSFGAHGNTNRIQNSASLGSWVAGGGGQQVPGAMTPVAPTGSENWQGFMTGLSVRLVDPYTNSVGIYQSAPGGLTMTVDKDAGTINGTMTPGSSPTFATVSNLQIGGNTTNSVYLRDDLMAALLTTGTSGLPLKTYGNFMVVTRPEEQFSSYVTWGYWQIAYNDSGASYTDRIMAGSYSLWIAGNPTSVNDMTALNSYAGTYTGRASGTELSTTGATQISGTCSLNANFNAGTVDGNINLGVINLPILTGNIINSNQFTAPISDTNISGSVKGGFFGPAASAMGGNFNAANSNTSKQYFGVFGGNRGQLTQAPGF